MGFLPLQDYVPPDEEDEAGGIISDASRLHGNVGIFLSPDHHHKALIIGCKGNREVGLKRGISFL